MAFIVVHFLETDEVSIASQSWLVDENICRWPPYENRLLIKRALLEKRVPENDWNHREIFVMAAYDTYAKAKKEVDIALQTDSDNEVKTPEGKEQKLQTALKSTTPSVPDFIVKNGMIHVDPSSPTQTIFIPYENLIPTPKCSESANKMPYSSSNSSVRVVNRNFTNNTSLDNITNHLSLPSSPSERKAVFSAVPSDSTNTNQDPSPEKICCSSEAKLISLEKQLKSMEATLTHILNAVKELKEKPTPKVSIISNENTDPNLVGSPPVIFSRIETMEEMNAFNDSLSNKAFFSELVKYFGFMGGRDTSDATRKILAKLMCNDLAKEMNWIGNTRKKSFQEFQNVIQLVVAAVRQNKGFKEATVCEVEGYITRWLRYSSDREGGRLKRMKRDQTDEETERVKTRRKFDSEETEEDTNAS